MSRAAKLLLVNVGRWASLRSCASCATPGQPRRGIDGYQAAYNCAYNCGSSPLERVVHAISERPKSQQRGERPQFNDSSLSTCNPIMRIKLGRIASSGFRRQSTSLIPRALFDFQRYIARPISASSFRQPVRTMSSSTKISPTEPCPVGTPLPGHSGRTYKVEKIVVDRRDPLLCVYRARYELDNASPGVDG